MKLGVPITWTGDSGGPGQARDLFSNPRHVVSPRLSMSDPSDGKSAGGMINGNIPPYLMLADSHPTSWGRSKRRLMNQPGFGDVFDLGPQLESFTPKRLEYHCSKL